MLFLAVKPWTRDINYFACSPEQPMFFDFPDDEVPSIEWYPLDQKALEAVQKLASSGYDGIRYHRIIKDIHVPPRVQKIYPIKKLNADVEGEPNPLPLPKGPDLTTLSEIQTSRPSMASEQPARPSDQEPPKTRR